MNTPTDLATDMEAQIAIKSGFTPIKVEQAIKNHTRAEISKRLGFDASFIKRLMERWGIGG